MASYEALYGRPCSTPCYWTKVGEWRKIEPLMVHETVEQMDMLMFGFMKPMTVRRVLQLSAVRIWIF